MNLQRRVEKLEERLGLKAAPYPDLVFTNVNFDFPDEPPPEMIVVPGVYLLTFGRRLTPEELEQVRADYKREHTNEI
jgi:hypothetical protein